MAIHRRVYKQGNSTVISLPAWMLGELGIGVTDYFKVEFSKSGYLKLTPVSKAQKRKDPWTRTGQHKQTFDDEIKIE